MRNRKPAIDNGFTIIELIMVISIIAILTVSLYPGLTAPSQFGLSSAANVVESDINLTQISAMAKGMSRSIIFSKGQGDYIYDSQGNPTQGLSRNLKELGGSIQIGSDAVITFNSLGEPARLSALWVTIINKSDKRKVILEPYTGKTKIE